MDLSRVPLTEKQLTYRMSLVDEVLSYPPGPKRWRATADIMLKLNPVDPDTGQTLTEINRECIRENRENRELLGPLNPFAKSSDKNSGLRGFLSMPRAIKLAIESVEPFVFKEKKNAALMFKAFPEYRNSEVY